MASTTIYDQLSAAQRELTEHIQSREVLEMQEQENKIVADEFAGLDNDARVYKLTGPVLLPQSKQEAEQNVAKRLEFIGQEIGRVEKSIAEKQEKVSIIMLFVDVDVLTNQIVQLRSQLEPPKE